MDHRFVQYIHKYYRPIADQANTILTSLKASGVTATHLDNLRTKVNSLNTVADAHRTRLNAILDLLQTGGTDAVLIDTIHTRADLILDALKTGGAIATSINTLQIRDDLILRSSNNRSFASAGLAEGTNANTLQIAVAVPYVNQGIHRTAKGVTDNIAMDAAALQAISTFCKYLVCLDAGGTVTITKGTEAALEVDAVLPAVPANQTPIGYFQIATDGATTFTSGTTDLGAAGITDTYVNLPWPDSGPDAMAAIGTLTHMTAAALGAAVHTAVADLGAHGLTDLAALTHLTTAVLSEPERFS